MVMSDPGSKKRGFLLILLIVVIVLVLSFIMGGVNGVFGIIRVFIYLSLIVLFIGLIFYVVYFLFFKKHRIDVTYENQKNFIISAKQNGADMMDDLILAGDKKHSAKRFMTIQGYLRVRGYDKKEYDLFVGKRNPMNPIEETKIVMLEESQHSDLIGDVWVNGISLIQLYGFYFLNTTMHDYSAVDKFVSKNAFRTMMYYTLGDMKGLIDRATGLDPDFNKSRQQEKLLKIPVLEGQQK